MIIQTYKRGVSFARRRCDRCLKLRWCCQHHIDRRTNSERVVWICSNGGGVLYTDSCHDWVHNHPLDAKKEGYYTEIDGVYRKKDKPFKMPNLTRKYATRRNRKTSK